MDTKWRHSNLICSTLNKVIWEISAQYVKTCKRKVRKTVFQACKRKVRKKLHFKYSKFQKGHNSHKNWRKLTTLKLGLYLSKTKSCAEFHLNISKHVWEKCGKQCIFSILCSKRGITPTKIDAKWRHFNFVCISIKQSHVQNFSSICQSM